AEIPVEFGIGYEGKISKHFSINLQAGLMTNPNSTIIIDVLEVLGTDQQITLMINDAFKFGTVGKLGLHYNFNRNYVGAFCQVIALHGGDTPTDLIESYFGEDISMYPVKRNRTSTNEVYLTLKSTLYQAGVLYGRRFPLKDKRFEIDTEFGVSANIGSKSTLTSENRSLEALSVEVDDELKYYYSHYAFVPSLTVALAYKFSIKK
ncbi:MAG: hypothetical protein ABI663_23455, partial [Chryseolinea sp.]